MTRPIWEPSAERASASIVRRFIAQANARHALALADYDDLHRWSIEQPADFWSLVWDDGGIVGEKGTPPFAANVDDLRGARWFANARLNFAENLLRRRDEHPALVELQEGGRRRTASFAQLHALVSRLAQAMRAAGVRPGDRVAGYLPNVIEAAAAMLAATAIGAIWSCCSPEYGTDAAVDRFGQIAPCLLIAADGYRYGGKKHELISRAGQIGEAIPSIRRTILVPCLGDIDSDEWLSLDAFVAPFEPGDIPFERLGFDHPVFILFSSGTTGAPKAIMHRAGGVLIENLKAHRLQFDVRSGDKLFWPCASGWVVWNIALVALSLGATVTLYDGSPAHAHGDELVRMAAAERVTFLRLPARYVDGLAKSGLVPNAHSDLTALRTLMCNGSVFSAESCRFAHEAIKRDVHIVSPSGGTDSCGSLVSANPMGPVWPGEIQVPALGFAIAILDHAGQEIASGPGELVVSQAFPTIPIGFWNDRGGSRMNDSYFTRFTGKWHHGDLAERTAHGGFRILGRSDATLNARGVRFGSAELYRYLAQVDAIAESAVVAQRWEGDSRILLFVKLREGQVLDEAFRRRLRDGVRNGVSPRHVPERIIGVADIPVTVTGKISEAAIRNAIHGEPVVNRSALANPAALEAFHPDRLPELRS